MDVYRINQRPLFIRKRSWMHGQFRSLSLFCSRNVKGQAVVEFTLVFVLLLVIAWIPADFGLGFYTGQLAQNASREGARIAASDPTLLTRLGTCTVPCGGATDILAETAERLSSALLPNASITVTYPVPGGITCNQMVRVGVNGTYNFFFYQLLHLLGVTGDLNTTNIVRETDMRWEHQC